MGQKGTLSVMRTSLICAFLFHYSLGAISDNNDRPAIENETVPDRPVTEIIPDPITVKPPGSTEELKPNLVGLANMAIVHLPRRLTFDHVSRATREIVDGVRYELVVHAKDVDKSEIICRLVVKELPWITTEFGDKFRELINTNCTATSEDDKGDPSKYEGNTVFNSSNTEVTHGDLSELEKQILASKKKTATATGDVGGEKTGDMDITMGIIRGIESQIVPQKSTTIRPSLSEDSFALLSSLFGMDSMIETGSPNLASETKDTADPILCVTSSSIPSSQPDGYYSYPVESRDFQTSEPFESGTTITLLEPEAKDISDNSKSFLDSIFMKPANEPEHVIIRVDPPNDGTETGKQMLLEPTENSDSKLNDPSSPQGAPETKVVTSEITEAQSKDMQIEKTQEYRRIQESDANVDVENSQSVLNRPIEVPQAQSEQCALRVYTADGPPLLGGAKVIPKEEYGELTTLVTTSLATSQLSSDGQDTLTGLSKIYCATTQVVSGSLQKVHAQFNTAQGNKKDCIVEIWSRSWISPTPQITYNCNLNAIRKRRSPGNTHTELVERILEQIPTDSVQRANGQPLFTK